MQEKLKKLFPKVYKEIENKNTNLSSLFLFFIYPIMKHTPKNSGYISWLERAFDTNNTKIYKYRVCNKFMDIKKGHVAEPGEIVFARWKKKIAKIEVEWQDESISEFDEDYFFTHIEGRLVKL